MPKAVQRQLHEIADSYACDKGLIGPSIKWSANNYVDVYEAYFCGLRNNPLNILEIGIGVQGHHWNAKIAHGKNIQGGASLRMWSEYFPNAQIFALDINDASHLRIPRVKTYLINQGNRSELNRFLENESNVDFDIIIDDGSHRADHQQISLETLFPRLKKGGFYFIEDLNDQGFGSRASGLHATPNTVSSRDLFRHYRETGELKGPHAFESTEFLNDIDIIIFHCPRQVLRLRDLFIEFLRLLFRRNMKGVFRSEFNPASHKVLALQRKR